jgi:hypothetical protein
MKKTNQKEYKSIFKRTKEETENEFKSLFGDNSDEMLERIKTYQYKPIYIYRNKF